MSGRPCYREAKVKPPRIFTGVDWGVDGSCRTLRLRREPDGRWTLLDEVFEPAKPKPAPNPVREWGMEEGPGLLGSEGFLTRQDAHGMFRRWRERLGFINRIRAEVPKRKPYVAFRESFTQGPRTPAPWWVRRVPFTPHPAQVGACYPVHPEPVSGNARGDDFLHDLWREDEKRTEILRRIGNLGSRVDALEAAAAKGPRETPPQPSEEMVERVRNAINRAYIENGTEPTALARAAIREVLR